MSPNLTESSSVQLPLIRYAAEAGWQSVSAEKALTLRRGESGTLFYPVLEATLLRLNPGIVTAENVGELISRIEGVRNSIEGNAEVLAWLRGERSVYVPAEKRQRNVRLVDYEKPGNNAFQVTAEWQYLNGMQTNRADVMFLVNGIPTALVETKSAKKPNGLEEALVQIRRYHRETPEMLTMPQVFDITHLIEFYYGATWNLTRKNVFNWRTDGEIPRSAQNDQTRVGDFERKVKQFFDHTFFLKMLQEWILFYVKDDELQKTVLRQHQTRAVEKVLQRCSDARKKTGLIWHTQGAGKTFTMITAARLLFEGDAVSYSGSGIQAGKSRNKQGRKPMTPSKPTVLLIIDRNELEGQLTGWVDRLLGELGAQDIAIERAYNKTRLRELLVSDFRGLIVSMIHKFDGIPKSINTRDNIYVLIDEAHRSTGGDLGNYLMAALPNATLIGFTGTPIDKTAYGLGTFKVFGKEDDQGYLDKYSIAESMADGTTLALKYALAPNDIRLPEEILEKEFLDLAEAEGVCDVDELNRILDKAVTIKAFLKADRRVEAVAKFVAAHFTKNVQPLGYKAFLVAVDREACALYKQALDKLLPPEWVCPIYTPAFNDRERSPLVAQYQVGETDEQTARKMFIKPGFNPQILIVTDKLLTGYDAPILYCMYLDKPMRDHVLLQAIARVNRPCEEEGGIKKPCGFVVDFVGIFSKLRKALAFDSKDVSGVIENVEVLLARFKQLMTGQAQKYLTLTRGAQDDKTVERAIDAFADKDKRAEFYQFFKEVEALYEILSPAAELRDYMDDFRALATLYQIVRNAFEVKTTFYGEVAKKTEMLVRESAAARGLYGTTSAVEIDATTLAAIQQSDSSDNAKVISLVKGLIQTAQQKGAEEPYLIPIAARAQAVREALDDRQISTRRALEELQRLARERIEAEKERSRLGLDLNTFTIYWALKQEKLPKAAELAALLNALFERFPDYGFNGGELRQLKAELYKVLLNVMEGRKMVALAEQLLNLKRR